MSVYLDGTIYKYMPVELVLDIMYMSNKKHNYITALSINDYKNTWITPGAGPTIHQPSCAH